MTEYNHVFAIAWACAENCDTCWYLLSDEAEERWGEEKVAEMLAAHLASGHKLTSEEL